nr:glycerate kinase [Chromobacterium sp. ASV5]
MKIVIAPDSFKESLSALEVAAAIEAGFRQVFPHASYLKKPMADGGEGMAQTLLDALGGRWVETVAADPLGRPIPARFALTDDGVAVIEMAVASGLALVPPAQRNPLLASSRGTGDLIRAALDAGARRFVLGIGGSASNDGGAGMLQALGVGLADASGRELPPGGGALGRLAAIDVSSLDRRLAECRFDVACDVSNPLTGPQGSSAVFGPQKGATPEMAALLDAGLAHFARLLARDLKQDVADVPGAGAAGGLGAAALAVLHGRLRSGSELVAECIGLDEAVRDADLVITGEGRIDSQSVRGKTPIGVARVAQRHGVPVIALGGSLAADYAAVHEHGVQAAFAAVSRPCSLEAALREAAANLQTAARNMAALLRLGMRLPADCGARAQD